MWIFKPFSDITAVPCSSLPFRPLLCSLLGTTASVYFYRRKTPAWCKKSYRNCVLIPLTAALCSFPIVTPPQLRRPCWRSTLWSCSPASGCACPMLGSMALWVRPSQNHSPVNQPHLPLPSQPANYISCFPYSLGRNAFVMCRQMSFELTVAVKEFHWEM